MKQKYNNLNFSDLRSILDALTADPKDLHLPEVKTIRAAIFGSCFAVNWPAGAARENELNRGSRRSHLR